MSETILSVFGAPLTRFGASAALAVLVSILMMGLWCRARRVSYGVWIGWAVCAIPCVWLMSRLVYVLGACTYYLSTLGKPALALRFYDGGYAMTGAIIGAIVSALIAEKLRKQPKGILLDGLAFSLPLGILAERLAEAGTGMGLGRSVESALPAFLLAEDEYGESVLAVFRLEAIAMAVLFLVLLVWLVSVRMRPERGGDALLVFLCLYGAVMVLMESLRNDGHLVVHFVRIQQVLAALMPAASLAVFTKRAHNKKTAALCWVAALAAAGIAIVEEFAVDSSENVILTYGIMALMLAVFAAAPLTLRRLNRRQA